MDNRNHSAEDRCDLFSSFEFSEKGLKDLLSALGPSAGAEAAQRLNMLARIYRKMNTRYLALKADGVANDLRLLRNAVERACRRMNLLRHESFEYLTAYLRALVPETGSKRFHQLRRELNRFSLDVDQAVADLDPDNSIPLVGRPQRLRPDHMVDILQRLAELYERYSSRRATHSTQRHGSHVSGAPSPFGQFAIRFFKEVDPEVPERVIGNQMRKAMKRHRASRQS